MFSLYKKLFSVPDFIHHQSQVLLLLHAPTSFEINRFSTTATTSLVNNVVIHETSLKIRNKKSKSDDDEEKSKAFTVSYLINSCGFSPQRALVVSAYVRFKNCENPNSILALFHKYGFSKRQVQDVVWKRPRILASKEKTVHPKLEFLLSVGVPNDLLGKFISVAPGWLTVSLRDTIIPNYNYLKSILLTDERAISAMKQHSWALALCMEKHVIPNIEVLRELKVSESRIRYLLLHYPETLGSSGEEFKESISKVVGIGFDPWKSTFVLALHVFSGKGNRATWDQCYETYSKWGWSKEDIYTAFRKHPNSMIVSEEKISKGMDFLVNKVGLDSKSIAQCPVLLLFSLEKRLMPRYSVIQVLSSRGLIRKKYSMSAVFKFAEKDFLNKFVFRYEKEVPALFEMYQGKVKVV